MLETFQQDIETALEFSKKLRETVPFLSEEKAFELSLNYVKKYDLEDRLAEFISDLEEGVLVVKTKSDDLN